MIDRIPTKPGRVELTKDDGTVEYAVMKRADEPTQDGTPLNKATLLSDETAALYGLEPETATPDRALYEAADRIGDIKYSVRKGIGENWALCNGMPFNSNAYPKLAELLPKDSQRASSWTTRMVAPNGGTIHTDSKGFWRAGVVDGKVYSYHTIDGINWVEKPTEISATKITTAYCNGLHIICKTESDTRLGFYSKADVTTNDDWAYTYANLPDSHPNLPEYFEGGGGYYYLAWTQDYGYYVYGGASLSSFTLMGHNAGSSSTEYSYDMTALFVSSDGFFVYAVDRDNGSRSSATFYWGRQLTKDSKTLGAYYYVTNVVEGSDDMLYVYADYSTSLSTKYYVVPLDKTTQTVGDEIIIGSVIPHLYANGYYYRALRGDKQTVLTYSDNYLMSNSETMTLADVGTSLLANPEGELTMCYGGASYSLCSFVIPTIPAVGGATAYIKIK